MFFKLCALRPALFSFKMGDNITICLIQKIAHMTFNDLKHKIFSNYEAGAISDYELSWLVDEISGYFF